MAKKQHRPWVRYYVVFVCKTCGSTRSFIYTQEQVGDGATAAVLARREHALAEATWDLQGVIRTED